MYDIMLQAFRQKEVIPNSFLLLNQLYIMHTLNTQYMCFDWGIRKYFGIYAQIFARLISI